MFRRPRARRALSYPLLVAEYRRVGTPRLIESLLELAEACDVPVRWSCRAGVCHNCEVGSSLDRSAVNPRRSISPQTVTCWSAVRSPRAMR